MSTKGKARIIESALQLFSERGFHAVSIRDIAALTGLSNPALYRHYPSKRALGVDVFRSCYSAMLEAFAHHRESKETCAEQLHAYVESMHELFYQDRRVVLYVERLQGEFWHEVRAEFAGHTATELLQQIIREGQANGSIREDISPAVLCAGLLGSFGQWAEMAAHELVPAGPYDKQTSLGEIQTIYQALLDR
jgi:AcrR family transcriptional regulator